MDSPSDDLNDSLIPTWDDADDIIRQIFEHDGDSSRGDEDGDGDDWENESSSGEDDDAEDDDEEEEADLAGAAEQSLVPPWLRKQGPMLPFARNKLPVISSDESSDEDGENGQNRAESSSDGEDSNAENRKQSFPRGPKHRRGRSHDSLQFRFSLPKHLLHKSTNPTMMEAASLKSLQVELSKAVRIPAHGELVIRADVLQRNHVDEALDLIRSFGYPTRSLVDQHKEYLDIHVKGDQHIFDAVKLFSHYNLTILPVVGLNKEYLGSITLEQMVDSIAQIQAVNEVGGIVVLEMNSRDYSMQHIGGIVESNNYKILSSSVTSVQDSALVEVTLKINTENIAPVLQTFERYDYTIKATFQESSLNEDLKDRFDEFMNYLNI